jgi:hypothetical protein
VHRTIGRNINLAIRVVCYILILTTQVYRSTTLIAHRTYKSQSYAHTYKVNLIARWLQLVEVHTTAAWINPSLFSMVCDHLSI